MKYSYICVVPYQLFNTYYKVLQGTTKTIRSHHTTI